MCRAAACAVHCSVLRQESSALRENGVVCVCSARQGSVHKDFWDSAVNVKRL